LFFVNFYFFIAMQGRAISVVELEFSLCQFAKFLEEYGAGVLDSCESGSLVDGIEGAQTMLLVVQKLEKLCASTKKSIQRARDTVAAQVGGGNPAAPSISRTGGTTITSVAALATSCPGVTIDSSRNMTVGSAPPITTMSSVKITGTAAAQAKGQTLKFGLHRCNRQQEIQGTLIQGSIDLELLLKAPLCMTEGNTTITITRKGKNAIFDARTGTTVIHDEFPVGLNMSSTTNGIRLEVAYV